MHPKKFPSRKAQSTAVASRYETYASENAREQSLAFVNDAFGNRTHVSQSLQASLY